MIAALVSGPPRTGFEQLGRATRTLLRATAAYYSEAQSDPTPSQRANMLGLLNALSTLYPCSLAKPGGSSMSAEGSRVMLS